jgi:DNA polymerase II small subunit
MSESKVVARVLASGYMLDAKAFDMINQLPNDVDADSLVEKLLQQKMAAPGEAKVITEDDLANVLPEGPGEEGETPLVDDQAEFEVIADPTQAISPADDYEGFKHLFRDRYQRLSAILRGRLDVKSTTNVAGTKSLPPGKEAKVAGLLADRSSRRGMIELKLDDPSGTLRVLCRDKLVEKAALEAPLDSMIVVDVSRARSGQFFASSVVLPDIPGRKPSSTSHRAYAVLLSDLHIGSRMFLADDFGRFIQWLNGGLGDKDIVSRIRYLVIAGDLVDGVGVYPGQEYQLTETDPKKQYALAAELLRQVPGRIQIVVSPGNHDTVRQALPQPAVPVDLAESLYAMDNLRWVGDPAYVKLNGVTVLVYHGKSLDDIIAMTPGLAYDKPTEAMKLLLRARHLAPTYGKRTALAPELRDHLVVDPVPDVFHAGHVHTYGELNYRGTLVINSGTWQAQTSFQSNMGMEPTPSIIPVLNLSTLQATRRNFGAPGFAG